jgi:hypothetical protein
MASFYRDDQHMIAIVAVQPNILLGRQYLLSPPIEASILIFWQTMTYCGKSIPLIMRSNCALNRFLQKETTGWAIF